jgi:hypothetical protein
VAAEDEYELYRPREDELSEGFAPTHNEDDDEKPVKTEAYQWQQLSDQTGTSSTFGGLNEQLA